jgi:hypothetical protein
LKASKKNSRARAKSTPPEQRSGVLLAALGNYKKAGYKLVKEEKHHSFGHDLVSETWELEL